MATIKQKKDALKIAVEITKEYVRGGGSAHKPDAILKQTYEEALKLVGDTEKDD